MKHLSLALLFAISSSVFAHRDHDWREDYMGYLSVEYPQAKDQGIVTKAFRPMARSRLDMDLFRAKLTVLSSVERGSTKNLDLTRSFLKEEYEKIGFTVSLQPFGSGTNFIAEKKGTNSPEKVLILSSHIDSVGNKGANDNGTGTIGLLTVAQELAKNSYASTIRVLGFDREERGLVGSDAYAATLNSKDIIGNINFEMMGFHAKQDGGFHVIDCSKQTSLFLSQAIKDSINELSLPLQVVKTCTDRSDHASFWRRNIPAVVISENFFGGDADPCYHAKCDVMDERLNYSYMRNILDSVLDATEKIAR
jgi:Zn-dependent M28 family amino/carboxypeptidase